MSDFTLSRVAGIAFAVTTMSEATAWLVEQAQRKTGVAVRLANSYCIALAQSDPLYNAVLSGPGVNFPDGTPIAIAMRMRRQYRRARRVRGPSFFERTLAATNGSSLTHYFLGGTEETLRELRARVSVLYPDLRIAGHYSPPFSELTQAFVEQCRAAIVDAAPDLVWLGLGTPKQDILAAKLSETLDIPCVGVGAAFGFVSGHLAQAPRWVQAMGLEWLYRLSTEPRRLWRRYLIGNFVFLRAVIAGWLYDLTHRENAL